MKVIAKTKNRGGGMSAPAHLLVCCLCGETDRDKLIVEDLGLAVGMSGDDYSFCDSCWGKPDLGKRILKHLGYPYGLKIRDDCLDLQVCDD